MRYFLSSIIWISPFSNAVRSKDVDRNFAKCSIHARRTVRRYRLWSLKPIFYIRKSHGLFTSLIKKWLSKICSYKVAHTYQSNLFIVCRFCKETCIFDNKLHKSSLRVSMHSQRADLEQISGGKFWLLGTEWWYFLSNIK